MPDRRLRPGLRVLLLGALLGVVAALPADAGGSATAERRLAAMGTWLTVEVAAEDRAAALAAAESAVRAVEGVEARLSTWRSDSELARLNAAPAGTPVPISPRLAADLETAVACWRESGGAFDPGVGALVDAWGLRHGGRRPGADELTSALAASGLRHLELRAAAEPAVAVRHHPGLRLEEGGFGKGIALAEAAAVLAADPRVAAALVDLGGQWVRVAGAGGDDWSLAVADPDDRSRPLAHLRLPGGSVATSGNGERGIVVDGRPRGHLLDPADGLPAADFGSLTVWTSDPRKADCLSTGLYVLGPDRALAWAASRPGVEVLVVERRRAGAPPRVRATAGLAVRLEAAEAIVEIFESSDPVPTDRTPEKPRAGTSMPWEGRSTARRETPPEPTRVAPGAESGSKEEYR